jgi:hypothetical protein
MGSFHNANGVTRGMGGLALGSERNSIEFKD